MLSALKFPLVVSLTLATAVGVPAAPAVAASSSQFDSFRLAGGSRFTVTVSRAAQVPGLSPNASPTGYRRICGTTGPVLRTHLNYTTESDYSEQAVYAYVSRPGSGTYTQFAGPIHFPVFTYGPPRTLDLRLPFESQGASPNTFVAGGVSAPAYPIPGLYDLVLMPYSYNRSLQTDLPAAWLPAKLDIHLDTTTCAPTGPSGATYVRAG